MRRASASPTSSPSPIPWRAAARSARRRRRRPGRRCGWSCARARCASTRSMAARGRPRPAQRRRPETHRQRRADNSAIGWHVVRDVATLPHTRVRASVAEAEMAVEVDQVERRSGLSLAEFMRLYEARCEPVIITDAARDWPATTRWTLATLRSRFAGRTFLVRSGERLAFEEIVDRIRDATPERPAPYLSNIDIPHKLPELLDDLQPPMSYARGDRLTSRLLPRNLPTHDNDRFLTFFVGGAGSIFPLHYDFYM